MNFLPLIEAKRDGRALSPQQLQDFVHALVAQELPDYQVASFLMAVFFRGLDATELPALTLAMRDSGEKLGFPADPRPLVDKHSTGGVGDKVSLPLAPLLACLGFRVPMISGRALGITGGTLDKLESIPGFSTQLPRDRIIDQVQSLGLAMAGQTERMVPADRILYALRDVTGTVPSLPLITASILSKKLTESLDALVLDVKFGRAAFMQTRAEARALAQAMIGLASSCGVNTRALLTDMDTPLGQAAGNWLEVRESVECLSGRGPGDLRELVVAFAAQLLLQTGRETSLPAALACASACLDSGQPLQKWEAMLAAQGADMPRYRELLARDSTADTVLALRAERAGYVTRCDARIIGETIRDFGGGRLNKDTVICPEVGVDQLAKPGQPIEKGSLIARIHATNGETGEMMRQRITAAFSLTEAIPSLGSPIAEVLTA
jgi:thymidine phosphorylase